MPEMTAKMMSAPNTVKIVPAIVTGTARLREIPYRLMMG